LAGSIIQSIQRAAEVLGCFKTDSLLGIGEISDRLGLHRSTTFGIVNTLTECRLLDRDPLSEKYKLGVELYHLIQHVNLNLRTVANPFLQRLVEEFGETANLVEHDNTHLIYIDKVESPHSMRICTNIGLRLPFYCSGVGRSILAFLPEDVIERAVQSYDYHPYTAYTAKNAEVLKKQLKTIREQGYCIDDEEFDVGILCVGVPIYASNGIPIAGISVSGPKARMDEETIRRVTERLLSYSRSISKQLYG